MQVTYNNFKEVVKDYPPNYQQIKAVINPPEDAFFPYGDKLYNPSGIEIPPDIMYHESIHHKRQKDYMNPSMWWTQWLMNEQFRKYQETEAFSGQLWFVKQFYNTKASGEALDDFAEKLSTNYKLGINQHQAKTLIRKCPIITKI